jgi:hypothetical protein
MSDNYIYWALGNVIDFDHRATTLRLPSFEIHAFELLLLADLTMLHRVCVLLALHARRDQVFWITAGLIQG